MGHNLKDFDDIPTTEKDKSEEDLPYSIALRA